MPAKRGRSGSSFFNFPQLSPTFPNFPIPVMRENVLCVVKKAAKMAYPQNFITANAFTQKWEKGYVNHPNDPGGATYNSVSLRFLKQTGIDINGDGRIDIQDILTLYRNRDQARVDGIFYKAFWRDPGLERFNSAHIQTALYDANVNVGRTQAAKFLQRGLNSVAGNSLAVDGIIGPKTLACANETCAGRGLAVACALLEERQKFHDSLVANSPYRDGRDYRPFGAGWRNRVNDLRKYMRRL